MLKRPDRVSELIQREVSYLLLKKIKDPRLELVTITGVKLSGDMKIAHVYYCMGASSRPEDVKSGFASAAGFLRRELGSRMKLRYTPEIVFHYDESFDYGDKIERILKELYEEKASATDCVVPEGE